MQKRPIKAKTSGLTGKSRADRGLRGRPAWLSLGRLAQLQRCSERTIREWCKQGLIPESYKTPGGHWRVRMPLSVKTRYQLEKRRDDWFFDQRAGDFQGDFAADFAEWLMLAQLYQRRLDEHLPVPAIAELGDALCNGRIDQTRKGKIARRIQGLIIARLERKETFSDLVLLGWVYQFWRKEKRPPTAREAAQLLGLSRDTFYRRYTGAALRKACFDVSGESRRDLPDLDGLDPVKRANLKSRKTGFANRNRDPFEND